ncbi:hypothetical protein FQZ97_224230 [compost metagenome]
MKFFFRYFVKRGEFFSLIFELTFMKVKNMAVRSWRRPLFRMKGLDFFYVTAMK